MRVIIVLLLLWSFSSSAQFNFKEVEAANRFTQSVILAIEEDPDGFMWFGTADGLNRFDGTNVTPYRNIPNDKNCICNNEIMSLEVDNDRNLWIGNARCLNKLDLDTYTFSSYLFDDQDSTYAENIYITSLFFEGKFLWIGTADGLKRMNLKTEKIKKFKTQNSKSQKILDIKPRAAGGVWVSYSNDICYTNSNGELVSLKNDLPSTPILNEGKINCSIEFNNELIIALDKGVVSINLKTNKVTSIEGNELSFIRSIEIGPNNEVYLGSSSGLIKYDSNQKKIITPKENVSLDGVTYDIFNDSHDVLWVSIGTGLIRSFSENELIRTIKIKDSSSGLSGVNKVWHLCRAGKNIIISTEQDLYILKPNLDLLPFFPKEKFNDIPKDVSNVTRTSEGKEVWMGTFTKGVFYFNMQTNELLNFIHNPNDPNSISDNTIRHIFEDKKGHIYFATDNGLCVYDKSKNHFIKKKFSNVDFSPLQKMVSHIHEDKNGGLWIGTQGGLFFYDEGKQIQKYYHTLSEPSISNNRIRVLHESKNDILWIGTSAGLNKLDIKTDSITKYYSQKGLPNDVIYSIEEDKDGDIWVGTNKGISAYIEDSFFVNYNIYDGLQGNEFNTNASDVDSDENLYFGGLNGVNKFNPSELKKNKITYEPIITQLQVLPHEDFEGTVYDFPLENKFQFSHEKCNFKISFSSLNFNNAENADYYYWLEGYDHDWILVEGEPEAEFMNLQPGEYTFHVSTNFQNKGPTDKVASLKLKLVPPFYMTAWFKLLSILIGLFLLLFFIYWRTAQVNKSNIKLNQLVDEQTQEIKNANKQSKSYLESIPDPLMVVDRNYNIEYVNKLFYNTSTEFYETREKNLNELKGDKNTKIFIEKVVSHVKRLFEEKEPLEFDSHIIDQSKNGFFYSVKFKPIINEFDQIEKCVILFSDITKNKETEQSIRQNEALFRSYFQNSPIGIIYVFNPIKNIDNCNPQFAKMMGYTKEEICNYTMMDLTHPDDVEHDIKDFFEAVAKRNKYLFIPKKRLIHKNGTLVTTETHLTLMYDENDSLEYIFGLISDVTQKIEDQKKLEETRNRLIQSDKLASLGHLTAGVAHEINNPVNFISNGVRGLQKTLNEYIADPNHSDAKELIRDMYAMINAIEDGSQRTANIVKSLRQFSREDTDHYVEADIITGLESTIVLLSSKLKEGIFLEKNYEKDSMLIYCYPGQLNQVFMNTILNAIQAIKDAGTIRVTTKSLEDEIEIRIADNGNGIPNHLKKKVFEPFYTTKGEQEGTGLGLSITFGIIKRHQGDILIEDNTPKGTQFIIRLPKKKKN